MLTERLFTLETTEGALAATLPEALARLCDDSLIGFEGLAAHQRHAWELFLYQTAALALVRSGEAEAAADNAAWHSLADAEAWCRRLVALTPGCADTAWSLVVDDLTRPAFLQPPIGTGKLNGYAIGGRTPDEIDVLVTAKGHDIKGARAGAPERLHWLFALMTLQTLQGYSGRGNFGIARMNGGFASRPLVMLTPSRNLHTRFRRGVQAALLARQKALDTDGYYYRGDGLALLWLQPWDTEESLSLQDLDPLFVEICRRVRLMPDAQGHIAAWGRPSETARIAVPKEAKGALGDAWTPISAKEEAALTVGSSGFDYRLMQRLLNPQEFSRPASMQLKGLEPDGGLWLHAAVLVRGQGKTEGLHERWLLIPQDARSYFSDPTQAEKMAKLSHGMIVHAEGAKGALRLGLLKYLQGGLKEINFSDERPRAWLEVLEQRIDGMFFPHLFARLSSEGEAQEETETAWRKALETVTRDLFAAATTRLSPPECRRERALAVASISFGRSLRRADIAVGRTVPDEPSYEAEEAEA